MDSIQDSFLITNKLPEIGLIRSIFEHTIRKDSKLCLFCIHGLVYNHYKADATAPVDPGLSSLIGSREDIREQFLAAIRQFQTPQQDPRVRDCKNEPGCVECAVKPNFQEASAQGVWPCQFHVHITKDGNGQEITDDSCYLWHVPEVGGRLALTYT